MTLIFTSSLGWDTLVEALVAEQSTKPWKAAHAKGPLLPLYSITYADLELPTKTRELMLELIRATKPVDHADKPTHINSDTLGAMRQIHANNPAYLPRVSVQELSPRAKLYDDYVSTNKAHSNNRGGGAKTTGYVEYTAGDNSMFDRGNQARVVFDYVNSLVYFSPVHYSSWRLVSGRLELVHKPDFGSGLPNPFFAINF